MADPNIDMIADALRRCSLGPGAAAPPSPLGPEGGEPAGDTAADTPLELHSDVPLPHRWEQCLDLKTGKIYYINWSTGAKTTDDPRKLAVLRGGCVSGDEDGDADDEDEGSTQEEEAATSGSDDGDGDDSSAFSPSSSASSRETAEGDGDGRGPVLVAAGCRVCMMYVMIPKTATECPRCGGHVINFGRSGNR